MVQNNQTKFKETEIGSIPEEWGVVKLGDLIEKIVDNRGKTPPITDHGYELIETFQISIDKKYPDMTNKEKQKYVSEETYNSWFRAGHPQGGDILFSTVGASIPQWCFVPKDSKYCIAQNLIALRPNKKLISSEFLRSYFNTPLFKSRVNGIVITTAQPSIKVPHLLSLEIGLPSLLEQEKIANTIIDIENKIEINRKINNNIEKLISSLFKQWFVDFEFPNENGKAYKTNDGKMINSELGEIPDIFEIKQAISILDFVKGVEPGNKNYFDKLVDNMIPFYRVGDMFNGAKSNIFIKKSDSNHIFCDYSDVLISTDGTVGRVVTGISGSHSGGIRKVISFDKNITNAYIYFWLKSQYVQDKLREYASNATTIAHASGALNDFVILYNETVMNNFRLITQPFFDKFQKNFKEIIFLSDLRNSLLPRLMSGKIRVI